MTVIALVRFTPHTDRDPDAYRAYLETMMPIFEGVPGLNRKYFCATETGSIGVYEWASEAIARAYYDEAWLSQMQTMAKDISVEILPARAMIDNEAQRVSYFI